MLPPKVTSDTVFKELEFTFSRSSGPGGQHVNKVNTKVGLRFNIVGSVILTDDQKEFLINKLANKLTKGGILVLSSQEARSQLLNKEIVIEKLDRFLQAAFTIKKKRKPTKPTKASNKKRLDGKKHQAQKKVNRQKP